MRELLEQSAQRAIRYLESLSERNVAPRSEAVHKLASIEGGLDEEPVKQERVLELLDDIYSPATMAIAGPRYFGFVTGGSLPAALAANWLAGAWDQNTQFYQAAPATSHLEQTVLSWLLELFKLPAESAGSFVTGATMANFSALAAARHAVLKRAGWNVEAEGLFAAPPITVVVSAETHATLFKSFGMLGLGRNRVVRVPVDSQGRMRADKLPKVSGPTIVCTQAGNVNTGSFDPIRDICRESQAQGAWVHVDGAFGLWATVAAATEHLAEGVNEADSWATDFHKWLNVPYDSGIAIVRDPDALRGAMAITAEYLPTSSPYRNPADYTPELSRRARGVEVWAALKSLGRKGLSELVERTCRHAKRFAEGLQAAGFEVLNEVVLNQVLVSFGSADITNRVISELQAEGTCYCGGTVWQGRTAMRISVSSWATEEADVDQSLEAMIRIGRSFGS